MILYDPAQIAAQSSLLARTGSLDRGGVGGLMLLRRRMAALFVVLALAGCASVVSGPGQAPNAPYQQSDPRDTSGMH